ncbi:MAG: branched-chain amino acid transaminase [Theionarchaea archaeon]|nr:branched-chain amino acid transaminase [Theionarchaea archaeon]MBU7001097.1 branched-chain amino acid transaminase [Theionarchaea archaeon]MBU7020586.1 branched-chain amino acid transaminase [Theionarchaea archaeon]MBU7034235.1 branched-chain amino acid transaminase [Theionarchaea archaeon]MBU7039309.1 branched-chain amino acid transaminase [Theionarchaea archaeon]
MEIDLPKFCFLEDTFVPWEEAKVPVSTHALHYGTAVFAGLRGYWNEEEHQLYVFRIRDHFERLHDSVRIIFIDLKYSVDELIDITKELLRKNEFKCDVYIRPLAFKSVGPKIVGMDITTVPNSFLMFALGFGEYLPLSGGLHVCTSTWRRIPDVCIPARGKISGAYANSCLAKSEATLSGFNDAVFLTEDGYVSEGSAMNLFIVRKGTIITTPVYADILEGITRRTLMQVARDLGIPVEMRPIHRSELYVSDEIFFCGTGVQLAPVTKVDHREVKNQEMPVTKRIQKTYFDIVRGKNEKYRNWLTPIYE